MKIITLTVNPAVDLHLYADALRPLCDNPAKILRRDSGGKGVNLSRALHSYGVDSLCLMMLGDEDKDEFVAPLNSFGLSVDYVTVSGRVRENINIHTPEGDTVIATVGPAVGSSDIDRLGARLLPLVDSDTLLCFGGRIAEGSDREAIIGLLSAARDRGAKLALDSKSLTFEEILRLTPFVIKPNTEEAETLLGVKISGIGESIYAANKLYTLGQGRISNVLLTLGRHGAILVTDSGIYKSSLPRTEAVSTVGAGDSSLAGFICAVGEGMDDADRLRMAVAFGSAACMEEGSMPPRRENIEKIFKETDIYDM